MIRKVLKHIWYVCGIVIFSSDVSVLPDGQCFTSDEDKERVKEFERKIQELWGRKHT